MEKMISEGVKTVIVQSIHIMNGAEYDDLVAEVEAYADRFDSISIGAPLLTTMEDYETVTEALLANNENADSEDVALVYIGPWPHHFANASYGQLEGVMQAAGYENVLVGTVEGLPTLEVVRASWPCTARTRSS